MQETQPPENEPVHKAPSPRDVKGKRKIDEVDAKPHRVRFIQGVLKPIGMTLLL